MKKRAKFIGIWDEFNFFRSKNRVIFIVFTFTMLWVHDILVFFAYYSSTFTSLLKDKKSQRSHKTVELEIHDFFAIFS